MKNISKRVAEALNKNQEVQLSAEKVELSNIKTLDKMRKGLEKELQALDKEAISLTDLMRKYFATQKEYKKSVRLTKAGIKSMEDQAKKFEKDAKALGLGDVPMVKTILGAASSLMAKMKTHIDRADKIK